MAAKALVTGASRGIGKAIALGLADQGYDVTIAARTLRAGEPTLEHSQTVHKTDTRALPGSIEETAAEIERRGRQAPPLRMYLTDLGSVEAAIAASMSSSTTAGISARD
jgi:NAD(P)-dependent dehydrogenase (short-subunit alcohol dehydrogenase family)